MIEGLLNVIQKMLMENSQIEEWREELEYLKERVDKASMESKREIQQRISELESRLQEHTDD